jgi:hypothetical protein
MFVRELLEEKPHAGTFGWALNQLFDHELDFNELEMIDFATTKRVR